MSASRTHLNDIFIKIQMILNSRESQLFLIDIDDIGVTVTLFDDIG